MKVNVRPELLKWARERASLATEDLARQVGTRERPAPIEEWERTGELPLKKLEAIAAKTHAPFGFLFLPEPPSEPLPIKDFRRTAAKETRRPSINLLETIYDCQYRQAWLSARLRSEGEEPLDFVGSAQISDEPGKLARDIRERLRITTAERSECRPGADAILWMMARLDESRIIVQRNGVVGNQTQRRLDRDEFKGFALSDPYAPLIFINGTDWHASQIFTLAHECVHLWLGVSALPDGDWFSDASDATERFCNRVSAEILMPGDEVRAEWRPNQSSRENARRLSQHFRVSMLAVIVRAREVRILSQAEFEAVRAEEERAFQEGEPEAPRSTGGNYYRTVGTRLGKRFIREVLASTLEGKTLYSEGFGLLGTNKTSVFERLIREYLQEGKP